MSKITLLGAAVTIGGFAIPAASDLLFQLTSPIYNESVVIGRIFSKMQNLIE